MFEKDEDYRKARKESKDRITKVIKVSSAREETLHDEGFKDGAEFGYNKARGEIKELLKTLIKNKPDTYSGTDVMANQKKMFAFSRAVNDAIEYLRV